MIALLLAWGAKALARPALLAGVLGAGALGGFWLYHATVVDGARERYIDRLVADNASKAATIANQELSISKERLFATTLQAAIDARDHTIEEQALKLKTIELSAGIAASQAFSKGLAAAKVLAAPTSTVPSDAPGMNAWQRCRLLGECQP